MFLGKKIRTVVWCIGICLVFMMNFWTDLQAFNPMLNPHNPEICCISAVWKNFSADICLHSPLFLLLSTGQPSLKMKDNKSSLCLDSYLWRL